MDLSTAKNVTLEYSIFFPTGFDFVKGGKMPGLYGGHTGCSGGQQSEDCFSTRLMVSISTYSTSVHLANQTTPVPHRWPRGDVPLRPKDKPAGLALPDPPAES